MSLDVLIVSWAWHLAKDAAGKAHQDYLHQRGEDLFAQETDDLAMRWFQLASIRGRLMTQMVLVINAEAASDKVRFPQLYEPALS